MRVRWKQARSPVAFKNEHSDFWGKGREPFRSHYQTEIQTKYSLGLSWIGDAGQSWLRIAIWLPLHRKELSYLQTSSQILLLSLWIYWTNFFSTSHRSAAIRNDWPKWQPGRCSCAPDSIIARKLPHTPHPPWLDQTGKISWEFTNENLELIMKNTIRDGDTQRYKLFLLFILFKLLTLLKQ